MGPTASGKTELAEQLADRYNAQLINADAFQVYRGFDIGTAKTENKSRYLLMDIRGPSEAFGVGEFVVLAADAIGKLWEKGRSAIVVGGTGLYIRALFEQYANMTGLPDPALRAELDERILIQGLPALYAELRAVDPAAAEAVDPQNPARVRRALERALATEVPIHFDLPPYPKMKIVLEWPKEQLITRIENRFDEMMQNGWIEEIRRLRAGGVSFDSAGMRAIGYRTLWRHLEGELSLTEAKESIVAEMRQYAKRQKTWLRAEPRAVRLECEHGTQLRMAMDQIAEWGG
ncbi:MAG: tRNA (adenosine(37)-N6)-dimethylallyltransferase MiaA [Fimbriimonadaceae bacterium]